MLIGFKIEIKSVNKIRMLFTKKTNWLSLAILFTCICTSCEYIDTTNRQSSKSISDSKKKGLFISQYKAETNQVNVELLNFEIVEIWSENNWYYDNLLGMKTIENDTQLVIRINNFSHEEYEIIGYQNKMGYTNRHGGKLTSRRSKITDNIKLKLNKDQNLMIKKI